MKCIFCKLVAKIEGLVELTVVKSSEAVELVKDVVDLVKDVAHDTICHAKDCCEVKCCEVKKCCKDLAECKGHEEAPEVCECKCSHCEEDCCLDIKCCDDCNCC